MRIVFPVAVMLALVAAGPAAADGYLGFNRTPDALVAPPVVTTPRGGYRPDDLPRYDDWRARMPYGALDRPGLVPMPPTGMIPRSVPPYERRYYIYNKPHWRTREWYKFCAERYPTFDPKTGMYRDKDGEHFCR